MPPIIEQDETSSEESSSGPSQPSVRSPEKVPEVRLVSGVWTRLAVRLRQELEVGSGDHQGDSAVMQRVLLQVGEEHLDQKLSMFPQPKPKVVKREPSVVPYFSLMSGMPNKQRVEDGDFYTAESAREVKASYNNSKNAYGREPVADMQTAKHSRQPSQNKAVFESRLSEEPSPQGI